MLHYNPEKAADRAAVQDAVSEYLSSGGAITICPPCTYTEADTGISWTNGNDPHRKWRERRSKQKAIRRQRVFELVSGGADNAEIAKATGELIGTIHKDAAWARAMLREQAAA